jgi:hypothetical protein
MIELVEGFWVDPCEVKIVKKIDDKSCTLWVTGEGYMDGHVIPYEASEVVQAILDAREQSDEDEEESD